MTMTVSAREFNQGASAMLKMAQAEPVFITKRGEIANVILSYQEYQRLTQSQPVQTLADVFANMSKESASIELPIERRESTTNPNREVSFE